MKKMSNIELLRIVSMFMVVMIHLMTKTSVLWDMELNQPAYYVSWFIYGLCMTGVNCYVLISGYFGIEGKFRLEKLLRIYFQVLFYSVVIAVVARVFHIEWKSSLIGIILPITHNEYWFATIYLGLYCLMPYLNIMVQHTDEKQLRQLLVILGILFSVIPTFLHVSGWLGDGGAYGIVWFAFLYLAGAFIRRYYQIASLNGENGGKRVGLYYLAAVLLIPVSKFLILFIGKYQSLIASETVSKVSEVFYSFNSLPALCASVFLFMFFVQLKVEGEKTAKFINFIGGLTFGIYLIHNNRNISGYLWQKLQVNYWLAEKQNLLVILGIWIGVFAACGMIEWIRQCLFKLLKIDKLTEKFWRRLLISR